MSDRPENIVVKDRAHAHQLLRERARHCAWSHAAVTLMARDPHRTEDALIVAILGLSGALDRTRKRFTEHLQECPGPVHPPRGSRV